MCESSVARVMVLSMVINRETTRSITSLGSTRATKTLEIVLIVAANEDVFLRDAHHEHAIDHVQIAEV